jgi:hypothetical protein
MDKLNLSERKKLIKLTSKKYRKADKRLKSKILDTFIGQTGYGRKYAIHVLANEGSTRFVGRRVRAAVSAKGAKKRAYPKIYDRKVLDALIPAWEAFNCQCGKLFAPFLHANIACIAADPRFKIDGETAAKLAGISPATIDRLLRKHKAKLRIKGTGGTKPAPNSLKTLIPTLSHFECVEEGAGLWQVDLVQHDGGNPCGEFCFTLTVTEVRSGWTVHYALKNKAFAWVHQALDKAYSLLPIPVKVFHSDNGSEFINHALKTWCDQSGIRLTRSRNDRKNDNCFVEQKNGNSVRKIIGYARYTDDKGVSALQAVYDHYDNLLNYFYPCQKLVSKERVGKKVVKKYDAPQTPLKRILADDEYPEKFKGYLLTVKNSFDLMSETWLMQQAIDALLSTAEPVPVYVSPRINK